MVRWPDVRHNDDLSEVSPMFGGRRIPPLVALRAFESFARLGLIRLAAEELSISHTVISRHIQNLEKETRAKLVRKSGRRLLLTPDGARYAEQISQALMLIAKATSGLRDGNSTSLHISCMAGLATRQLLPLLPEIEHYLGIRDVMLEPTTAPGPTFSGNSDVELTFATSLPIRTGFRAEAFARPRIIPVASPDFAKKYGPVAAPAGLVELPLIHERSTDYWHTWLVGAGMHDVPELHGPRLWQGHFSIEAALLGQGVALVSTLIAQNVIASGELVELVPSEVYLGHYVMIASNENWKQRPVHRLHDWLVLHFSKMH